MEAIIVTGLSGAGKSNAMNYLEDMGYYCIDNMPPALLESFITLEKQNASIWTERLSSWTSGGGSFSAIWSECWRN